MVSGNVVRSRVTRIRLCLALVTAIGWGCGDDPASPANQNQADASHAQTDAGPGADADASLNQTDAGPGPDASVTGQIGLGEDGILQVWTVGDSITEGVNNGYRNRLWTVLTGAGYGVDFVGTLVHPYPDTVVCTDADHDGHAGYTIGGMEAELDAWYAQITTPDVALIMAGTNDLAWWVAPGTEMSQVAADLMTLVDHALGLDADLAVIVATIAPMASEVVAEIQRDRAELVIELNQALATAVEAHALHGTRLWLADVNAVLTVADLYDGIHPTREAHDRVADAWLAVLQPLLVAPP